MNLQCPQCKIVNAPDAKFCKGCGVPFAVVPIQRKNSLLTALGIAVGLLILCGVCGRFGSDATQNMANHSTYTIANTPQVSTSPPIIKLLSMNDVKSSEMFFTVTGEIQNDSTQKIDDLSIIITTYDKNDNLVGTESGLIDYDPLMPNQISAYKVVIRENPAIKTYKIGFKHLFGEQIPYVDARKTSPPKKKK